MIDNLFITLYLTILGLSILGAGLAGHMVMSSKSYEEEMKWERLLVLCTTVCMASIGIGILTLVWLM